MCNLSITSVLTCMPSTLSHSAFNTWRSSFWLIPRACACLIEVIIVLLNVCYNCLDNVATLFRGTSAATTLMDQYMKMVAVPYVQRTLRDVVIRIMDCKQSCEVWNGISYTQAPVHFWMQQNHRNHACRMP